MILVLISRADRVSELVNGRIHTLSADKLIGYLALLGFQMQPVFNAI